MKLSKHGSVMKALVEEVLRRHGIRGAVDREPSDVLMALEMMKIMLKGQKVYAIADSLRFVKDFSNATGINVQYFHNVESALGIHDAHIIVFHTGARTQRQQIIFDELIGTLRQRSDLEFWHVGVWRVD